MDSLSSLTRSRCRRKRPRHAHSASGPKPRRHGRPKPRSEDEKIVDSTSVSLVFSGSPAAARACCNQIAARQRSVLHHPHSAGEKPGRQRSEARRAGGPECRCGSAGRRRRRRQSGEPAITFIVGTEHLDVAAKIEIVQFNIRKRRLVRRWTGSGPITIARRSSPPRSS